MANPLLDSYRQQLSQQSTQTPQAAPATGGVLGFLKGIVSPFIETGKNLYQSAASVGAGTALNRNTDMATKFNKQRSAYISTLKPEDFDRPDVKAKLDSMTAQANAISKGGANISKSSAFKDIQSIDPTKAAANAADVALTLGSLGVGALAKTGAKAAGTGILKTIAKGAGEGAVFGGAYGGLSPLKEKGAGATAEDVLSAGVSGVGTGAVLGGGASAVGNLLGKVGKGASKVGTKLESAGKNVASDVIGIKNGAKIAGKGILKPQYIDDLGNLIIDDVKPGKLASASKILVKTQNYADDIGKQITDKITKSATEVSGREVGGTMLKNLSDELIDIDNPAVKSVLDKLNTATTPKEIWELRKIIDGKINWVANPDAATSANNAIYHSIRDTLSDALGASVEGLGDLNRKYSLAGDAVKLMQPSAVNPGGLNILGNKVGGEAIQAAKGVVGRSLAKGGTALSGAKSTGLKNIIESINQPGILNAIKNRAIGAASVPATPEAAVTPEAIPMTTPEPTTATDASPLSNIFGNQQVIQTLLLDDIQKTGGKNIATIKTLYDMFKSSAATPKYSSAVAGSISDINSSLNELDNLTGAITSGKGTLDPILGTLRSMNPYDVDQKTLLAMIDKTRQIVGKALEGGVLRKEDEEKYKKILPTTSDTKEVAINKIEMIKQQLGAKLQDYTSLVSGGSTVDDLLTSTSQQQAYDNLQ